MSTSAVRVTLDTPLVFHKKLISVTVSNGFPSNIIFLVFVSILKSTDLTSLSLASLSFCCSFFVISNNALSVIFRQKNKLIISHIVCILNLFQNWNIWISLSFFVVCQGFYRNSNQFRRIFLCQALAYSGCFQCNFQNPHPFHTMIIIRFTRLSMLKA